MRILINNKETETNEAVTLGRLLEQQGLNMPGIAVAIEGKVVRKSEWETTPLSDGMRVTVISAVCGG